MTNKLPNDMTALAAEALDLWQEHLTALASDPKAKADLASLMEPSRRMFAEWMQKAQTMPYATPAAPTHAEPEPAAEPAAADRPAAAGLASDDGAVFLARLALHVADLEKRVAKLEASKQRAPRKTSGAA